MHLQSWLDHKRRERRREAHAEQTFRKFLKDLRSREPMSESASQRAAAAVLCALELRLFGGERRDLESQLPSKLRELVRQCPLHFGRTPQKLDREELIGIVAEETGTTRREAERLARIVFLTLRDHVSEGEIAHVVSQLPEEIAELWKPPVPF